MNTLNLSFHPSKIILKSLCVNLLSGFIATLCTVAHQATLSMGFPRQESWSGLPFPSPDPGIKLVSPASPALPGGFLTTEPPGKPALMNASL